MSGGGIINTRQAHERIDVFLDFEGTLKPYGSYWLLSAASVVLTADEGIGVTTATSIIGRLDVGGMPDQRVLIHGKWISPSTPAAHDIGVILRLQTILGSDDNYYYVCLRNGVLELRPMINGSFGTTLTSIACAVPEDEIFTMDAQVVHDPVNELDQISATVTSATVGTKQISAPDDQIFALGWGGTGIRTQTTAGYFRDARLGHPGQDWS